MLALAVILFFVLFLRVRSYKECMNGSDGRPYSMGSSLTGLNNDINTYRGRLEGPFERCSPESHPHGCGSRTASLVVMGRHHVMGIPTIN